MTIEKAKDYVIYMFCGDCQYAFDSDCSGKECKLAMDTAIEALEKQKPIKPVASAVQRLHCVKACAVCGAIVVNGEYTDQYCYVCGQKIDLEV